MRKMKRAEILDQTGIYMDNYAPLLEESTTSVPYNHDVVDGPSRYHTGPATDVPFAETAYTDAMDKVRSVDPLLAAHFEAHWDHRLRSRVREAARAHRDGLGRIRGRAQAAVKHNGPIEARQTALAQAGDQLLSGFLKAYASACEEHRKAISDAAHALAEVGLIFNPEHPDLLEPDKRLLRSRSAHAAEVRLSKGTYPPDLGTAVLDGASSTICGVILGFSAFGASGILHLKALEHEPMYLLGAVAAFGFAVTSFGGRAVKWLWHTAAAASSPVDPRPRIAVVVAGLVTAVLIGVDTVVDFKGLMSGADLQTKLASLSGHSVSNGIGAAAFWVGSFASIAYFTYASIIGWRKGVGESNLIDRSVEAERLDLLRAMHEHPRYSAAVNAINHVLVTRQTLTQVKAQFGESKATIDARNGELQAQILEVTDRMHQDDVRLLQAAITEARGMQHESDELVNELRQIYHGLYRPRGWRKLRDYIRRTWDKSSRPQVAERAAGGA